MSADFLKSLIALLAQSGGSISLPLADLQQLGVEVTLDGLGAPDCLLRLRLGAKIYYVPQAGATTAPAAEEAAWPTTPATPQKAPSKLDLEIDAINQLNNRPRRATPPVPPPEEPLPSPSSDRKNSASSPQSSLHPSSHPPSPQPPQPHQTEAQRQESLTATPPAPARVVPKSDMDLFLREQQLLKQKALNEHRKQQLDSRRGRQFPWETRNAPPLKLQ